MNPFFFGESKSPLYGVYHPPRSAQPQQEGILLCYPFGQEYMRAHRAFRQVAMMLTKRGYPVLRFDYHHTGDSGGDSQGASLQEWIQDVHTAVEELKDSAGVTKVSLIGLRLGAALAATVSSERDDLQRVVLWDPIISGQAYCEEIIQYIKSTQNEEQWPDFDDDFYMNGFPLLKPFRQELAQIDLAQLPALKAQDTLMVVSHESAAFQQLSQSLQRLSGQVTYRLAPSPGNWNFVDNFGGVMIPHAIIQAIMQWFDHP